MAYGAHYDHIGIVRPTAGDSIANGADDDGSGSMALLAIARVMQQAPVKPRRSVLFVWHIGEEKGLLGSSWFTDHPTVPIDSIVAQINADMIGRNADSLLYVVGPRGRAEQPEQAPRRHPRQRERGAHAAVRDQSRVGQRRITRSTSTSAAITYSYAKKGIPIVFLTTRAARRLPQGERRVREDRVREDGARDAADGGIGTRRGEFSAPTALTLMSAVARRECQRLCTHAVCVVRPRGTAHANPFLGCRGIRTTRRSDMIQATVRHHLTRDDAQLVARLHRTRLGHAARGDRAHARPTKGSTRCSTIRGCPPRCCARGQGTYASLPLFAYVMVRHALRRLGEEDRRLADYVAAVLMHFGVRDNAHRVSASGRPDLRHARRARSPTWTIPTGGGASSSGRISATTRCG